MPIRIAVIATNMIRIDESVAKGTEVFVHGYVRRLAERIEHDKLPMTVTVFASGNSDFSVPIVSTGDLSSIEDPAIGLDNHKPFEMALVSKAFQMDSQFDMYHIHLSNGEHVLPFVPFTKKPVIITMHGGASGAYIQALFDIYKDLPNVYFISISDSQRRQLPGVHYYRTIYHGIDLSRFAFSIDGGEPIMWAGRGIPDKGLDTVFDVINAVKKPAMVYPILKSEHLAWLKTEILSRRHIIREQSSLIMDFDVNREELSHKYRAAKLFLFPICWDEPFGLVMAESLASGTPVVAYNRGSVPEVISNGETGFVVSPEGPDELHTGISGLIDAVMRIYSLPSEEYQAMRVACRKRAESLFSIDHMIDQYVDVYRSLYQPNILGDG